MRNRIPHWPNAGVGIVTRLAQILEIVWNSGDCSRKPVWKRAKSWTPYPLFASQLYSCELIPKPVVLLAERKLFQLWDLAIVMCRALWHPNILLDWTGSKCSANEWHQKWNKTVLEVLRNIRPHRLYVSKSLDTISENRKELQHGTLEWAHWCRHNLWSFGWMDAAPLDDWRRHLGDRMRHSMLSTWIWLLFKLSCHKQLFVERKYVQVGFSSPAWEWYNLNPKTSTVYSQQPDPYSNNFDWTAYSCQVRHDHDKQQLQAKNHHNHFHMSIAICILPRISSAFAAGALRKAETPVDITSRVSAFPGTTLSLFLHARNPPNEAPKASHWFVYALVQHETFCHCPVLQNLNENRLVLSGSWCFSCLAWAEKQICLCPWPSQAPCLFSAWTCCFATAWNRLLSLRVYCLIATAIISLRSRR